MKHLSAYPTGSRANLSALLLCIALAAPALIIPHQLTAAEQIQSAEKTSFHEVTAKLDPGGNLFTYLSTSQWLENLSETLQEWRQAALDIPALGPANQIAILSLSDLLINLVKNSGVEEINAIGLSGIALQPELYQTKIVIHRNPREPQRGMWSWFGATPRPLHELDWLPSETAWAAFSDFDAASLWSALNQELDKSNFPPARQGWENLKQNLQKATGLTPEEFFASLGNHFGLFLTLDPDRTFALPMGPEGVRLPQPAAAAIIQVRNEALYKLLVAKFEEGPQLSRSKTNGIEILTLHLRTAFPFPFQPTIARHENFLFAASNEELMRKLLSAKSPKNGGLKQTDEFKRLAQNLELQGNSILFVSERFGEAVQQIQKAALNQMAGTQPGAPVGLLQKIYSINPPAPFLAVNRATPQGWFTVARGESHPANALLMPAVIAPTAVLAGMMLPALTQAKAKAQSIVCVNNLKQLGLAARIYSTDHNDQFPPDILSMQDIIFTPKALICPADPKTGSQRDEMTWQGLDEAQISYEYVSPGIEEPARDAHRTVLFRCRIHGHEGRADGSVVQKPFPSRR